MAARTPAFTVERAVGFNAFQIQTRILNYPMTPQNLRDLADSLDCGFTSMADRFRWASDLRTHADELEVSGLVRSCYIDEEDSRG